MASEWARKIAHALCVDEHCDDGYYDGPNTECVTCLKGSAALDAALDEARAEGRAEALGDAIPLKDLMAEALAAARAEGEQRGAERERWAMAQGIEEQFGTDCGDYRDLLAFLETRGPMLSPVEEP